MTATGAERQYEQERLARRPWLDPDDLSLWEITGTYPGGHGTFTRCLAMAIPRWVTGGGPLLKMVPLIDETVDPEWVTSAKRLLIVHEDMTEWEVGQ